MSDIKITSTISPLKWNTKTTFERPPSAISVTIPQAPPTLPLPSVVAVENLSTSHTVAIPTPAPAVPPLPLVVPTVQPAIKNVTQDTMLAVEDLTISTPKLVRSTNKKKTEYKFDPIDINIAGDGPDIYAEKYQAKYRPTPPPRPTNSVSTRSVPIKSTAKVPTVSRSLFRVRK